MSFLLGALGSMGSSLLSQGVGFLAQKAAPLISKAGSWLGNMMGGIRSSSFGRSSMDYVADKAMNGLYDGMHRFANSDLIRKKIPIAVPYIKEGADQLRKRLREGYGQLTDRLDTRNVKREDEYRQMKQSNANQSGWAGSVEK